MPTWDAATAFMMVNAGHDVTAKASDKFDALLLVGGPDVSPSLYKQPQLPCTHPSPKRELRDVGAFKMAAKGKPKVGICFGGQLLNCLSGGRMWQDVEGHRGVIHDVKMSNGQIIQMNSTHHQMMIPASHGVVLGLANVATKKIAANIVRHKCDPTMWEDHEIIWYPKTASLCFQPHPEFEKMKETGCRDEFFRLIDHFIAGTLVGKELNGSI